MKLHDTWHFHRPALANSYLTLLDAGLVTSTTIFAPRRAGKTSFLLKDLAPTARAASYAVAYADLWQTRVAPGLALVRALEEALEPVGGVNKLLAHFKAPVRKIKAKADVAGAKLEGEVELGEGVKAQSELTLRIDELVATLCAKAPLLLLVDEAQELARTREHEAVATALRTTMTKHQHRLRVVFTGSSRTRLGHVFSNASAPLARLRRLHRPALRGGYAAHLAGGAGMAGVSGVPLTAGALPDGGGQHGAAAFSRSGRGDCRRRREPGARREPRGRVGRPGCAAAGAGTAAGRRSGAKAFRQAGAGAATRVAGSGQASGYPCATGVVQAGARGGEVAARHLRVRERGICRVGVPAGRMTFASHLCMWTSLNQARRKPPPFL
ncbi:conserved hypothetical protein [Ricinus communis]|uniref:Uncharacterized protein n=1 Tax=Ricinus communis TaxID=3988 RepID=B9TBK3_RICCO|nr:conserved hypothetical protein [Ricinus communis]